ncbi:MAG: family 20 glycosylhydrolase [Alphaproteobacteria bacterium]
MQLIPAIRNFTSTEGQCDLSVGVRLVSGFDQVVEVLAHHNLTIDGPVEIEVKFERETDLPTLESDENYAIDITPNRIEIRAAEKWGALHALTTLDGLIENGTLSCGSIQDEPAFPWRGLKLDCVRHKIEFATVLNIIEGMAAAKLNVLHWGLCNNQGWRVESNALPRLHEVAADGHYYTQDQIREAVSFAAAYGIRVVPEFNMPGHSSAILVAYPELAAAPAPNALPEAYGIIEDEMHPFKEAVFEFADTLIGEMKELFPDPYWHFGGDEVTGKQWEANTEIQAQAKDLGLNGKEEIQAHFTARLIEIIKSHGKTPMGWEEVAHGKPNPDGLLLENWISPADSDVMKPYKQVSAQGYYLDHFMPAEAHWHHPVTQGDADVIGGEACAWAEAMNDDTIIGHIFPRIGAIAEVLWCGKPQTDHPLHSRLAALDGQLLKRGIDTEAGQRAVLKRCGGGASRDAMRTLAQLVSPIPYYLLLDRGDGSEGTIATPFNRFVQALRADPPMARSFAQAVDRYIATGDNRGGVEASFALWESLPTLLADQAELLPLADAMAELAQFGRKALKGEAVEADHDIFARHQGPLMDPSLQGIFGLLGPRMGGDAPLLLRQVVFDVAPALQRLAAHKPPS